MEKQFEIIRKARQNILHHVDDLTPEQLNKIPNGFNNNIIWNLGHLIAAQQGLSYKRGGQPIKIEESFFEKYKPGTKPQGFVEANEIAKIKELLLSTVDELEKDYQQKKFGVFQSWTTRTDIQANSIDDAINFIVWHDGLHNGYIMALKHCI